MKDTGRPATRSDAHPSRGDTWGGRDDHDAASNLQRALAAVVNNGCARAWRNEKVFGRSPLPIGQRLARGAVMSVPSQLDIGGTASRTADLVHSGLESLRTASPWPFADSSWEAHHNEEEAEEHSN